MNEYLTLGLILFCYMTTWFLISILFKRNDVADIAWGLGFILMAWSSYFLFKNYQLVSLIVNTLVTIWGLRLSLHILKRNAGKKEDFRYMEWRKQWGKLFYIRSYLQVYLLQGFFLFLIVLPTLFINSVNNTTFNTFVLIGLIVWITGFLFESIGDKQLANFIKDPKNKGEIMQSGLWKYTRHPNYFGEVTLWWGIFFMTLGFSKGIYTIIGPLTITTLILFVSGIPLLEKKYIGNVKFEKYKKKTSVFFPLPPKK